jgi:hypothetical protein
MACHELVRAAALSAALGALGCSASDGNPGGQGGSGNSGNAGGIGGGGGSSATGGVLIDAGSGGDGATEECNDTVDIVFVMDVSTSMGPFLNKLAQEILAVDQAIQQLELVAPPQYGLVVFVDDTRFISNGQPYTDLNQLKQDFETWSSFTSSNQQTMGSGFNTTWPENSLDALHRAAKEFAWRPATQTLRMIIHTTDDTFWNGPTTQDGVQIQHSYAETVAALQEQQVRVFSFAAKLGGSCECENVQPGWFSPYQGAPAIPDATGGAAFDIDQVLSNQISLSAAIHGAVDQTRCQPYPIPS